MFASTCKMCCVDLKFKHKLGCLDCCFPVLCVCHTVHVMISLVMASCTVLRKTPLEVSVTSGHFLHHIANLHIHHATVLSYLLKKIIYNNTSCCKQTLKFMSNT